MQEHSLHQEGSDLGGSPKGREGNPSGQATLGEPVRPKQVATDYRDETIQSFAQNILRLGSECRILADENARLRASSFVTAVPVEEYEKLKAEVERLRKVGDEVIDIIWDDDDGKTETWNKAKNVWNAAKEGKPSV